jgi:hypothetical protein
MRRGRARRPVQFPYTNVFIPVRVLRATAYSPSPQHIPTGREACPKASAADAQFADSLAVTFAGDDDHAQPIAASA